MLGDINRKKAAPAMSALPPKADILRCTRHVRFVPIEDICITKNWDRILPHRVGSGNNGLESICAA